MEVESVPYIFGSFSRRKPSHAHLNSESNTTNFDNRKLPEQSPVNNGAGADARGRHAHSRSQPETGNVATSNSQQECRALRTRSCNLSLKPRTDKALLSATCPICNHVFLEPRVLECLHSFCTRCLQDIIEKNRERGEVWLPRDDHSNIEPASPTTDNNSDVDVNYIQCPVCNERTPLYRHGVIGLPPDYVVQHRLVLATLNDENTKLLCDLCTGDIVAIERCSQCMVNVCAVCAAVHRRHVRTAQHELLRLRDVRRRGLMRIKRHLMCHTHPEHELVAYCSTCEQTACPLCISLHHSAHRCAPCPPTAAAHGQRLRRLLGRARGAAARDQALRRRLTAARRTVQARCHVVAEEVEKYMEEYRRVVEKHREKLLGEIETIRSSLLTHLSTFESSLSTRLQSSSTTINFSQALLDEGSDVELLTFVNRLLKKLEDLEQPVKIAEELKELLKQSSRDRSSDHDGLVDFVPQNLVQDFELEKRARNFDAFQRPIRHVLVDFVPSTNSKEEIYVDKCSKLNNKEEKSFRKSVSSTEESRNSKNLQTIVEVTSKPSNIRHSNEEENLVKKNSSIKRKSNNLLDQKISETSKPMSGLIMQLKNCLENHPEKKSPTNKPTKYEETPKNLPQKIDNTKLSSSSENMLHSHHQHSIESLTNSESSEDIILEFLPLEPEIYPDNLVPVVFGQIKKLTENVATESNNCCSAARPHLGGNPGLKTRPCCGKTVEGNGKNNGSNRKSDTSTNGKMYQITI